MARLVLQTAEGQQVVDLRATNSLGRHPSNSIQLLDKIVSKEHCIIEHRVDHYVLRDLGSLNGTFINRDRVHGERRLQHGDEIALGQTKARFEETAGQQQPQQPGYPPVPQPQQPWPQPSQQQPAAQQPAAPWPQNAPPVAPPQPHNPAYARQPAPPSQALPGYPQQQQYQQAPPSTQAQPPASARRPLPLPTHATRTPARGFTTAYLPRMPSATTHIDQDDEARQIGAEIKAEQKEFLPYDDIATNSAQVRADYERLRLSYELTRDIADEKEMETLLEKILKSVFRFIPAQRGVIFLHDHGTGDVVPYASHRNDGSKGPISVSNTILQKVVTDRKAVLTHDAAMDFAASKGKSMILNQISSAIVAPMLHNDELFGVLWLDSKSLAQFQPKDLELVSAVANQGAMFIEVNMLQNSRERLSRLLSPNVAEQVIKGNVDVKPGGQRTECTVFNSDIRGFTRMSEHTPPEEIVAMLNGYFEEMVETIFKFEGTLDKFMGDGIMALWGAPVPHEDDVQRAAECALLQTEVLGKFNRERLARDQPALGVGLGIHTGHVVAGYIGSSRALSYTVIGDVANTSARICALALAGQIVVSEATHDKLGARFVTEELAPQRIKGKNKPMRLWNVVRQRPQVQVAEQITDQPTAAPA